MWALLYDPGHVDSFDHLGEAYAPLRRLIEELALKEYAGRVYAFDSGASFILTTAPDAQQVAGHDEVGIEYNPARGVFEVGYIEWAPPGRKARHRAAKSRVFAAHEVGEGIDGYVKRMPPAWRPPKPEMTGSEAALLLVMFAGMLVFLICWSLMWAGLEVGILACLSMAVVAIAWGLHSIGVALIPSWRRNWAEPTPGPRPGDAPGPGLGPLTSIGIGLWCGAIGLVFLWVSLFGELSGRGLGVLLGTLAAAGVLVAVGHRFDLRRAEAVRAIEEAKRSGGPIPAEPSAVPDHGGMTASGVHRLVGRRG